MFGQRTTDPEPVPERAIEVEPSAEPVSAGGVFETGERWRVWATRRLATRRGLGEILDAVLDGLMKGTGAERGFLALERAEGPDQVASDGMEAAVLAREQHERRAREAVQTHRPVLDEGPPPMAYLPLLHGERVVAVAYLEGPPGSGPASEADLLEFCGEAAEVLDSARAYSRAVQDPLTGVPVHPYFLARLGEEIRKADRYHRPISVLAVGLDHFGLVNEVHGRAAGDSVLAEAASVVRARLREVDLIARRGGDVFLVALPETDRPGATVTAERIRRALEGHGFEAAASAPEGTVPAAAAHGRSPLGTSVSLTASVGLAAYPRDAADAGALVDRALDALTAAKRERNRVWTAAGAPRDEAVTATGTGAINFRDLGRAADELIETLGKVSQMELDLDRLLRHVLGRVMELTRAERGLVALVDGAGGLDMHGAQYRRADAPLYNGFAVPEGVLERVLDSGTGALVREVAPGRVPGPRSYIACPLEDEGKVVGVVYVDRCEAGAEPFAHDDIAAAVVFLKKMAAPVRGAHLIQEQARELVAARRRIADGMARVRSRYTYGNIIGKSKVMRDLFDLLERIVESDYSVVIQGESGTGKELVAKAIHFNGPKRGRPFIAENCAALTETLLEAELFGYVKGAFTGATRDRKGLFELAHGGTLFLDEVGEMSLNMQRKLLRALEEGQIRPVGGKEYRRVSNRVICATNRDLRAMVEDGSFREDLYYRLNVVTIHLPPLRKRREDMPLLVDHFLETVARKAGQPKKVLDADVMDLFMEHRWPGNVRELENVIKNACVLCEGEVVTRELVLGMLESRGPAPTRGAPRAEGDSPLVDATLGYTEFQSRLVEAEREYVRRVLRDTKNNKTRAAEVLGVTRPALYRTLKRLGLEP